MEGLWNTNGVIVKIIFVTLLVCRITNNVKRVLLFLYVLWFRGKLPDVGIESIAVSYTHLTLPTKLEV